MVDKYTEFVKKYGNRAQQKQALEILLPTSSLYDYLEGRIPRPDYTYIKLADIVEAEEKERINKEIGERRTRLGARIDQVTIEVKRDVLADSKLEQIYHGITEWSHNDEVRRSYEEKTLQHAYETLTVLSSSKKAEKRKVVWDMAQGLVVLKHPSLLAWKLVLEWNDAETIEQLNAGLLRDYTEHFPEDGLGKVLRGYLESEISPFPKPTGLPEITDEEDTAPPMDPEDRLLLMTEGLEESSNSLLSHRIMGEYFIFLDEYETAVEVARKAQGIVRTESNISGLDFQDNLDAINLILATSLIRYQAPRNHPEARELFETILQRKPLNTAALVGVGLILEEQEDYMGAIAFLSRAAERNTGVKIVAELAWCKALHGDYKQGLQELQACLTDLQGTDKRTKELKSQVLYRTGICMWNLDTSIVARKDRNGAYIQFLASLQADINFAPAYTSLGIYYADYGKDKKRARKCFQKAFELSASEIDAAERLANAFAKTGEWDLVEVVAKRVVDSGKIRPAPGSKRKGVSWPFAALGVVQMNNQEYAKSIVSFQSALRITPSEYHCWVGLGESYHNSGRYIAATKAFEQAEQIKVKDNKLLEHDTWFAKYMLANVKRELGEFDAAIDGYKEVLLSQPGEYGVSMALLQTAAESAWRNIELGFFGLASKRAAEAIKVARGLAEMRSDTFNLWKAVGDACSVYCWIDVYATEFPAPEVIRLLSSGTSAECYEYLAKIDGIGKELVDELSNTKEAQSVVSSCLQAAVLSQKRAIHASANDVHAKAVAWYNLGWTEHRAHVCRLEQPQSNAKKKPMKHLRAAVHCFKRAIELEAGNSEFWNSLGIVTTSMNPKIAQHSFVRSLYLNDKSARVWTNLGAFYLMQEDIQLANDAFTRAQSADPNYAHAWLGQGLLAQHLGDAREARSLFTHAFEIADSSSLVTKQQYALSVFDFLLSSTNPSDITTSAIQPLFALHQLQSQHTNALPFQHLFALFAERIGDFGGAITSLIVVTSKLEAQYETSESPTSLAHFARANADLARVQLASNDFTTAADSAEAALTLSVEDAGGMSTRARRQLRLSAHLTAGLAYYCKGSMDESIGMFRSSLEESEGNPDIVCLLARVLWAKGGIDERNVVREQLFDCVEKYPDHVGAVSLLGVIAVLDRDKDTIDAVTADLQNLRAQDNLDIHQKGNITRLFTAIATLNPDQESAELADVTTAIMLSPSQPQGWNHLAELAGLVGDEATHPAEMALLMATRNVPPRGTLDAEDLCDAFAGTGGVGDAQRAVMVAPWKREGWEGLS